jgi:hypothetical protein
MATIIRKSKEGIYMVYDEEKECYSIWFGPILMLDVPKERFVQEPEVGWTLVEILFAALQEEPKYEPLY